MRSDHKPRDDPAPPQAVGEAPTDSQTNHLSASARAVLHRIARALGRAAARDFLTSHVSDASAVKNEPQAPDAASDGSESA